jgi:uncharacterized damage-inducible protein DinB
MFAALAELSSADLDATWGGSFGTGRGLLHHVLGAERLWAERWNQQPASSIPTFPSTHAGAQFRDEWRRIAADQRRWFDSAQGDALSRSFTYTNIRGQVKTYMMDDVIMHVVNHGTYHRGQLSQLLRDRGHASPSTDMIVYYDIEAARPA